MRKPLAICAAALFIAACTTRMEVQKVKDDESAGIRYYLPQPMIVVTPAKDGTVAVTVEMLPDTSKAYAISSKSFLAKHKLTVEVDEKGLLKKVGFDGDSTELAKAELETAATLTKTRMETTAAAAKKAAEDEAEAKAAGKKAIADAELARDKAKLEFEQAEAILQTMVDNATGKESADTVMKARTEVARTRAAYMAAEAALAALLADSGATPGTSDSENTPLAPISLPPNTQPDAPLTPIVVPPQAPVTPAPVAPVTTPPPASGSPDRAWGPVLYRVINGDDIVDLEEVKYPTHQSQLAFRTSSKIEEKKEKEEPTLGLRHTGSKVLTRLTFTVRSNVPIESIDEPGVSVYEGSSTVALPNVHPRVTLTWTHELIITLPKKLPPGDYRIEIPVTPAGKKKTEPAEILFVVPR